MERVRGSTVPALFRLWLPTVFGASMLVVEIPVVAAAAARSADGGRALAAIGVGMSILVVWAGAAALPRHGAFIAGAALSAGAFLEAFTLLVVRSRAFAPPAGPDTSWRGLVVHHAHLSAARLLVMAPTVMTAAGLGPRWAWWLLPLPALWVVRAYLRGVVMAADAARWLSVASLCHTVALVGVLLLATRTGLPGVGCAVIALVTGVVIETAVTAYAGRSRAAGP